MTAAEKAEIEALLTRLSQVLHGEAHRTVNVFQIFLGEVDLAIERARGALRDLEPEEER